MKLAVSGHTFDTDPRILKAPADKDVLSRSMDFFDKDGYELNHVEELYYRHNNINLSEKHLYHTANHVTWFYDTEHSNTGVTLDHSMIVTRYEYGGPARRQIRKLVNVNPLLNKLLGVKMKWGIDISIDYVYDGGAIELFHIEQDFTDVNHANETKFAAEQLVLNTDWEQVARDIIQHRNKWEHLNSDDQADWKARHVGWHRAFDNQKVYK